MACKTTMLDIIHIKNKLNEIAELGWKEVKTTEYIKKIIGDTPLKQGFNGTQSGLVYKIGKGKKSILLRADIDALKTAQGVRHTCGHSTHMAALMMAYHFAKTLAPQLTAADKSLYFLFQPAEETFPSGGNAFVHECPDIINSILGAYALHVRPLMKLGTIGLQPGPLWARGDYMEIEVKGKMVHIKNNETGIDALFAASLIIQGVRALQLKTPSIRIGVGVMEGGRQPNAVADYALLKGDVRLKKDSQQARIKQSLNALCKRIEKQTHAQVKLTYYAGCPSVHNSSKFVSDLTKGFSDTPVVNSGLFSYGCEDFSYISERIPSVMALIGTGDTSDLHEEKCTISDSGTKCAFAFFKRVIELHLAQAITLAKTPCSHYNGKLWKKKNTIRRK